MNRNPDLVGRLLQFRLPKPHPTALAATAVGRDHQGRCIRIGLFAHRIPPAANCLDGETGRIVVGPHADPSGVSGHVLDPVGIRAIKFFANEVMHLDQPT